MTQTTSLTPPPWWKVGFMWLVVGGPLTVVVASFVTLYLAISRPDPVYRDAVQSDAQTLQSANESGKPELAPAVQARNHAATGGMAKPVPSAARP